MWLPIALADLMNMLVVTARRAAGDRGAINLLPRSKILETWALPAMSAALAEDEQEKKAFALLESVRNLGKQNEQKHPPV